MHERKISLTDETLKVINQALKLEELNLLFPSAKDKSLSDAVIAVLWNSKAIR